VEALEEVHEHCHYLHHLVAEVGVEYESDEGGVDKDVALDHLDGIGLPNALQHDFDRFYDIGFKEDCALVLDDELARLLDHLRGYYKVLGSFGTHVHLWLLLNDFIISIAHQLIYGKDAQDCVDCLEWKVGN
jgi:hypothetical protein